jgi:hypothetical protein
MKRSSQHEHVLAEILARDDFPVALLHEAATGGSYFGPLAKLILESERVATRQRTPWEFKSLADFGEESFVCRDGRSWIWPDERWQRSATRAFSECVCRQLWFHEEGLLFYLPDDSGNYRLAKYGDPPYDFVSRLIEDDSVGDLSFCKPPSWARELFLFRKNYDAHRKVWDYDGDLDDPLHDEKRAFRRNAVWRETRIAAGAAMAPPEIESFDVSSLSADRWPWGSHETELLRHLEDAAKRWWANFDPADNTTAPRNEDVSAWLQARSVSTRIADAMATILRADRLPTGPRT